VKLPVVSRCWRASDRLEQPLCLSCSIYAMLSASAVHNNRAYRHRTRDRVADQLQAF
jgi:hypothetical protein